MEYTKQTLTEWIRHEYSRIEGQLAEGDLTKDEFREIELLLVRIGEVAGIKTYAII